ncbi:MAG: CopY family transcriptional repressor [Robiginitomaculum sp.]|nr:MAG: CopY family transcriptional repressor [Robiginitomaculum sp.]
MHITEAELDVMNVVWANPGMNAVDVFKSLSEAKGWSVHTVKSLLSRLVEKGALSTELEGRRYLYSPAIRETAYRQQAATRFVERVFAGRAAPLVAHFANAKGLSDKDIEELEDLLEQLKK